MGFARSNRERDGDDAPAGATFGRVAVVGWGGGIVIGVVLVGLLVRVGQELAGSPPHQSGQALVPSSPALSQTSTRQRGSGDRLALVSASGYEDPSGYQHVRGRVTNISNAPLLDVATVVLWYTDWEDFVTRGEGPIEVNPLLPGQTSAFDVVGPVNPFASKFSVLFNEAGGDAISTVDRR